MRMNIRAGSACRKNLQSEKVPADGGTLTSSRSLSLLAEEEVRQKVGDVLVELVLRRKEHGLVVDQQQQRVEEEQEDDAQQQDGVGTHAILLRGHTDLGVQGLQEVAKASPDAHSLGQRVAHAILRQFLARALHDRLRVRRARHVGAAGRGALGGADEGGPSEEHGPGQADQQHAARHRSARRGTRRGEEGKPE
eukprot:CAMPEP_0203931274 /NCGR_PEP_ID=MMETSP0359-20131031/69862_1 /ASSEMBLY_ACC=CAM_ASM_000338 /TAXON_ID=268821 /ORGANISM="Scrippsiella Hangoei, Strain SHTV-5" /LENGTH=193 /DNA_ID=CAMNT_0050860579 /DNA_START=16 /DNA_END=595 /DNA_ORIENTATION=-